MTPKSDMGARLMYKNATLLLIASVARYAGQLGVFVLTARWLGPADAGTLAFALAVTAPVFIVASLGMRDVYLTLRTHFGLTHYERLRTITVIAAMGVSVGISFIFPFKVAIIVAIVACWKALDSFGDVYSAALQKASRIRLIVLTAAIVAGLQVGTLAITLTLGGSLPVALAASTLSYLIVMFGMMRPLTFRVLLPDDRRQAVDSAGARPWLAIARVGFPTGISYGLITLLSTMPQYFLGWAWGPVVVGKYAMLLYLVVALEMALNALSQSWIPSGRNLEGEGQLSSARVLGVALRWTIITVPLGLVGIALATVAFPLILGPTFAITPGEILPLGFAMALTPTVFASTISLTIQNRYHWGLVASVLTVLAGICLGWALIGPFGIAGALWTYAGCLCLRAGASLAFAKHEPSVSRRSPARIEIP
jgi:O-antigen/teichoic acid export membrane protein